jgi:hypothetical protein
MPGPTLRDAGKFLLDEPHLGSEAVLDFLERLADMAPRVATAIREGCDDVAGRHPHLEATLRKSRERIQRRTATESKRPHLLVRIERDMADDADDKEQKFEVKCWSYLDEGARARPGTYGEVEFVFTASAGKLADLLVEALADAAGEHNVVELMVDDLALLDHCLAEAVDTLTADYLVVLRPNRPAEPATWFRNWHRVLAGAKVTRVGTEGSVPADCPAIFLVRSPADWLAFEVLNRLAIPVMIWGRKSPVNGRSELPRTTSFHTPEEIDKIRRAAGGAVDPALIWHNPHWFPNERDMLEWRDEVTS